MTFLNPAILFGLFAAAIPIVLHFLNLRKLKKIEFSTLIFLKELQKTKIRRIKLKQWLLLLIRVLIVTLLVLAFARPTLNSFSLAGSSTAKTTAVIIIDDTFSMSVLTDKGSYFNKAKQIAKNILGNLQPGDEVAVIQVSGANDLNITPTTSFAEAKRLIDRGEISQISGTLNRVLMKAAHVLYQSRNFNKEIYLITDLQKGRLYNSQNELSFFGKIFSPETRLYLLGLNEKPVINLGIENLKPENQVFEKGKTISLTARIKNYSNQPVSNSVISLFINGKRSAQQNVTLAENSSREISFETTLQDTGNVEFCAELDDDDILQDNKRYWNVYVPANISLLLLSDKSDDTKFVKLALGIPTEKIKLSEQNNSQAASINLNRFNALIVIGTDKLTDGSAIANYVSRGGNIILFPGSQNTPVSFQRFLNELALKSNVSIVGNYNGPESVSEFRKTDFQHPLLKNIFENKTRNSLESPAIFNYLKINPANPGRSIISLIDNSAFLSQYKIGNGNLLLFNSAPVLSWNSFPLQAFFTPLINNALLYSSTKLVEDSTAICGNEITLDISVALNRQIEITRPDNTKEYFNTDSLVNKRFLNYKGTTQAGVYKFTSAKTNLNNVSVNHDPRESTTEKFTETNFRDYLSQIGYEGKLISLSPDQDYLKLVYQSRFGTELWKYFLILVMVLAIAESFLAKNSKKDMTT